MTVRPLTVLVGAVTLAYPFLVYAGMSRLQPQWLAGLLGGMALLRAIASRTAFWWAAAAGAGVLAALGFAGNSLMPLKLYPLLVNGVMCCVFAVSLVRGPSAIERMARLTEPHLPPEGVAYCRTVTQVWCGFFMVNGGISLATAVWGSNAAWALYNGLISYGLMGLLFAGEWLVRRHVRARVEARAAHG